MEEGVIKGGLERGKGRHSCAGKGYFGNFNSFSNLYARAPEAEQRRKKEEHSQRGVEVGKLPPLSPRLSSDHDERKKQV